MIALALADSARARAQLRTALEISSRFHPRHADAARATLRALGR
jgi:hypothetical protein